MCLGKDISITYRSIIVMRGRKIDISLPSHIQICPCNERKKNRYILNKTHTDLSLQSEEEFGKDISIILL
jgi:hypothetical protein